MSDAVFPPSIDAAIASGDLDPGSVYTAFGNERRRTVLAVLSRESTPKPAARLARDVAAREANVDRADVPDDRVERVHATLHHVHLPKLADLGLLEYDPESGHVTDVADSIGGLSQ